MDTPTRAMTLEVRCGSEPISGVISDEGGTRPFTGWLELAAALHAAIDLPDTDASG